MFKTANPLILKTISPLHVGSGTELGIVDLPIQREKHTGFPKVEGSSLKGAIREAFETKFEDADNLKKIHFTFGYDDDSLDDKEKKSKKFFKDNETEFAGAIALTDAKILFFPVKAMKGVFAYVTSPFVLKRFADDLKSVNKEISFDLNFKLDEETAKVSSNSSLVIDNGDSKNIVLEEYSFKTITDDNTDKLLDEIVKLLGESELKERVAIIPDSDFKDFLLYSTEVITRTKINNTTGTVEKGGLFNEEFLPSEAFLYSLTLFSDVYYKSKDLPDDFKTFENVKTFFKKNLGGYFQLGGNATIGKGIVKTNMAEV